MENIKNNTAVEAKENNTVAVEAKTEYKPFYDVKMIGVLSEYDLKDNGEVQFIFEEKKAVEFDGIKTFEFVTHSLRLKPTTSLTTKDLDSIKGQNIEIKDVVEKPIYEKHADGETNYDKVERMTYVATSYSKSNETQEGDFKLFRMFDIDKVANIVPLADYNARTRKKVLRKGECTVQYHIKDNKGTRRLKDIKVIGLDYKDGLNLIGKKIKVNDYKEGKTSSCTSYKEL